MQIKALKKAKPVEAADVKALRQRVEEILEKVKRDGDAALSYYSKTFDRYEGPIRIGEQEIQEAKKGLPADIIKGLDFAIERVSAFAQAQRAQIKEFEQEMIPGVYMGHRLVPVDSCAAYVPAGRYPCLTSAVMSLAPAKVGVKEGDLPGRNGRRFCDGRLGERKYCLFPKPSHGFFSITSSRCYRRTGKCLCHGSEDRHRLPRGPAICVTPIAGRGTHCADLLASVSMIPKPEGR
jgi:hypothetical protein